MRIPRAAIYTGGLEPTPLLLPAQRNMVYRFQCRCGELTGEISQPDRSLRAVCYCGDCQAYAHVLGPPQSVLDPQGGTDVLATNAGHVKFTSGTQTLACLSLSPRGLLRWYASCCSTPIGNTPRNWKLPYVGLVHTCLRQPDPLEQTFPTVQLRVNTKAARGRPPRDGSLGGMARFAGLMLRLSGSRFSGGYKATPFFDTHGEPIAEVVVTPRAAVEDARRAVQQSRDGQPSG